MDITKCCDCQIRWERDIAIKQLEEHGITFGCIQVPMTLEQVMSHIMNGHPNVIAPLFIEFKKDFSIEYVPRWRDAYSLTGMSRAQFDNYGITWRCWRLKPTDEERMKAKWREIDETDRVQSLSD